MSGIPCLACCPCDSGLNKRKIKDDCITETVHRVDSNISSRLFTQFQLSPALKGRRSGCFAAHFSVCLWLTRRLDSELIDCALCYGLQASFGVLRKAKITDFPRMQQQFSWLHFRHPKVEFLRRWRRHRWSLSGWRGEEKNRKCEGSFKIKEELANKNHNTEVPT